MVMYLDGCIPNIMKPKHSLHVAEKHIEPHGMRIHIQVCVNIVLKEHIYIQDLDMDLMEFGFYQQIKILVEITN